MQRSSAALPLAPVAASYAAIDAFVAELVRSGLRHACIAPGARSTPLTLVLAAQPGLRAWSHVDERSAAFFALGLAKASRAPVAVVCTSGTAAANFLPAVVEAAYARVPLLVLTADRPAELRECGAPQAIDQLKLYGVHAKWFAEVGDAAAGLAYFRSLACRAMAIAAAAPAGAVHLNFPLREPLVPEGPWTVAPGAPAPAHSAVHEPARVPTPATAAAIAAQIAAAPRGVIVCGPLDHDAATVEAIVGLAERSGYPVLADATSQLRNGPHDIGRVIDTYDVLLRDADFAVRAVPQLVLRFGALPTSKALTGWLRAPRPPSSPRQIVVDPNGGWSDPLHAAAEIVHCDVAPLCQALAARLEGRIDHAWLELWRGAARRARTALDGQLAASDEPFEGTVVDELARRLPDGSTLYVGNSMAMRDLELFWPRAARRVRILCNRGANGIDGFVSSALGAAAASDGPLVALSGDLGFLHDLNGLLAAKRHGVRATFVVLNNDGGGIFSYLPQAAHGGAAFDEFFRTPHGLDLRGGVEMYGCAFHRAASRAAFASALHESLQGARTAVIEVPIDLERSVARHRALWEAAGRAAGGRP
jgi:2-succinyl-5-enolpyruvyl-6-hydroxy-3-cyclohexene-1-carboxylate synthase